MDITETTLKLFLNAFFGVFENFSVCYRFVALQWTIFLCAVNLILIYIFQLFWRKRSDLWIKFTIRTFSNLFRILFIIVSNALLAINASIASLTALMRKAYKLFATSASPIFRSLFINIYTIIDQLLNLRIRFLNLLCAIQTICFFLFRN